MKTKNIFSRAFFAIPVLATALLVTSCDKGDDDMDEREYTLSGNASGSQENPTVSTNGTATLTGTYNADNNKLDYTINWTGISGLVTAAHFHGPALAGINAGVLNEITIGTNGVSGSTSGSVTLADSTEAHLLAGRVYYNIHTALHPTGEIRGQVVATVN